jgi:hypothetical protein
MVDQFINKNIINININIKIEKINVCITNKNY